MVVRHPVYAKTANEVLLLESSTNRVGAKDLQGIIHSNKVQLVPAENRIYAEWSPGEPAYSACAVRWLHGGAKISCDEGSTVDIFLKEVLGRKYDCDASQWLQAMSGDEEGKIDTSEYFCSELVADAYRHIGLIPKSVSPSSFLPNDFATNIQLDMGYVLGPLIPVETHETNADALNIPRQISIDRCDIIS